MVSREITVAPDKYEIVSGDVTLLTELRSALAVCVYDAEQEAGALLHLRCIVRSSKPADVTDSEVRLLPEDVAAGPVRHLRFRPAMGWVHTRA